MSVHNTPAELQNISPSPRATPTGRSVLNNVLPVLTLAKESVTGLGVPGLEAAVGGTLKIFQMLETMRDNKEDLADLCSELEKLKTKLDKASSSVSAGDLVPRLSQTSTQLGTIIVDCKTLQKSHKIKRFLQGARLAKQITDIKQSIRDMIQNFVFFSSISIEDVVGDMASRLKKFTVSAYIDKLAHAPARYDAADTPSKCMDGTRVDLLEDLMDHATNPSHPSRITIVYGIPGSGKSTIAKTIAIGLAKKSSLAASFFFSRNHDNRRELKPVFSTIAFQLAYFNQEYGNILSDILESDPDLSNAEPEDHLDKLVIEPLSRVSPPTDGKLWVIALDALDECGSDHGYALLQLLTSRLEKFPQHIRFFLTGRPEDPILSAFEDASVKTSTYKHTLDVALAAPVSEDIRRYVTLSLRSEWPGRRGWKAEDDDLDVLVTRAGGLFIFAATAVKYVQGRAARYNPQTSMEAILRVDTSESNPRLLYQLYLKVVDDAVLVDDPTFLAQYQRVLGAIVYLQEPLSPLAIAELLGMEFNDVGRIIGLLSSVLLVSEETVRIAHLSFREFITDAKPKGPRIDLFLDGPARHSDLATSSIDLMNKKLHRNMCGLDTPDTYAPHSDVPNLADMVARNIPPVLRYACSSWASHFQTADNVDTGKLEMWLRTNVLFWLEVLSLCGELSRAIPLITAAQNWYQRNSSRADFKRYNTLLSDTERFTAAFFNIISLSAGHTYYSALPFTPSSSELSSTYSHLAEQSVRAVQGVDPMWSPLQWTVNTGTRVCSVAFSPSGRCIASTCGNVIEMRSSETGKLLSTLKGHTDSVWAVAFSPDGTRIVSGSDDDTIWIWSLETGQSLLTLKGHTDLVRAVAFSPDGTRIVSGSGDRTVRIWSSETGQSLLTLKGHTNSAWAVAFSPDGTRIVSGSGDRTVWIWSSETGKSLLTLKGHTNLVWAVAFSPDGTHIVSGSSDETIRIWSSETGQLLSTQTGYSKMVKTVACSLDDGPAHVLHSPSLNPSTATPDHFVTNPSSTNQSPQGTICFDDETGWITLLAGTKPICILPTIHTEQISTSDQTGSGLALGYYSGRVLILNFSHISHDIMTALSS